MDLHKREEKLLAAENESLARIEQIRLLRIGIALLLGRVNDAEDIAATMPDRTEADQKISEFKEKYAGFPHGQWDGGQKTA